MEKVITVVGGGATALSFLDSFITEKTNNPESQSATIYVIEKQDYFGPGVAYNEDSASNILNTKSGYISAFANKPGDFFDWLHSNPDLWEDRFPGYSATEDSYAPRPLFGMYLQHSFAKVVKNATQKNIKVVQINAEAVDVSKVGKSYVTKTSCSLNITSDLVLMACGTIPNSKIESPATLGSVVSNPYPVCKLTKYVKKEQPIAIIGARLSAIDAVVALVEEGHEGEIHVYSRSGFFPSIRGTQGRFATKYLNNEYLDTYLAENPVISLDDIITMVSKDLEYYFECNPDHEREEIPLPPKAPNSIEEFIEHELAMSKKPRGWQAVLYSTNAIIERLWIALKQEDKEKFLAEYFATFMSYRVSIPSENGERILNYIKSGQVKFFSGDSRISKEYGSMPVVAQSVDGEEVQREYGYIVYATGSPKDPMKSDSKLIRNLVSRGDVQPQQFGGIEIDTDTYQVTTSTGAIHEGLYASGELTVGNFFFTSAMDIIVRHAMKSAKSIFEQNFITSDQPSEELPISQANG